MQQGLEYAKTLKIPFVFSSNGDGFVFHDRTGASAERETNLVLDAFPSPADLWARYRARPTPRGTNCCHSPGRRGECWRPAAQAEPAQPRDSR
jgi:type I site-specific restriction endonuclease